MYKKTITYTDFNGNSCTEDFYFNLTKAEVLEMEASENGGYGDMLKSIVDAKDGKNIMKYFKNFILNSYGIKSEDGKRFIKSEELSRDFEQTEAYSVLFMELCTNADEASKFVSYVLPLDDTQRKELEAKAQAQVISSSLS